MKDRHDVSSERDDWYEEAFGALYPILYAHRDAPAAQSEIRSLLDLLKRRPGGRVLDLCCGAGRHLAALVAAGVDAVGLDLSLPLLVRARTECDLVGRIVRGDMRTLPFGSVFSTVVNLFSSFGYFSDDEENTAAVREMARVLQPGGDLVIDHMNKARIERTLVPESKDRVGAGVLVQRRRIRGQRVEKESAYTDGAGRRHTFFESVRMYAQEELTGLLARHGLHVTAIWGDFSGEPFEGTSPRMIIRARKAGNATGIESCGS